MVKNEEIRKAVSDAYAKAITKPSGASCCGPAPGSSEGAASCCAPSTKSIAESIGYSDNELSGVPDHAAGSSLGCGNPLAFSEVQEGETVLDLGSGAGLDILIAAKKVGSTGRVIGIDMTDEMLAAANRNIEASGLSNVEVRKGLIEEMPVSNTSVDWVISNCVINLSPEKDRVFEEIARVLKPGGRMLVSDIVVKNMPDWIKERTDLHNSCVGGAISEEEYVDGLKRAGLEAVEVRERVEIDVNMIVRANETIAPSDDPDSPDPGDVRRAAEDLTGNIWSAKFFARKPA